MVQIEGMSYLRQAGDLQRKEPLIINVDCLPFFIGDSTPFWDFVDAPFYNAMDGSVNGMSLVIELLDKAKQTPTLSREIESSKDAYEEWEGERKVLGVEILDPEEKESRRYDMRGIPEDHLIP